MPPERIGKYQIDSKIGQGAMGEVWKAHDAVLNREVAIKTISADAGGDDNLRKRFLREAQSAARLNHPNIITVYDFGDENDTLYMAMELLTGNDLRTLILRRTPMSLEEKLHIMEQSCEGLAFAHSQDIVHRDIKPANIYIQPGGQVKIVDFGLARMGGSEMTRTGTVMGTPHYMSPEQVRGERADFRSDVFSLGACFYELLTGKKPFEADSMHAVLFKVMQEEPEPVKDVAPDVPSVLSEILIWAMAKDPADRFQDAGAVHVAIAQARQAIAEGRGEDPMDELQLQRRTSPQVLPTSGGSGHGERSRFGSRPGSGSKPGSRPGAGSTFSRPGSGSRPSSGASGRTALPSQVSAAVESRSRTPLFVAGGAVAALLVAGLLYALRPAPAPAAPPATRPAQVDSLAQAVAGTEVELATRKLASGDYREAARRADRALRMDPSNPDAKKILDEARKVVETSDKQAAAVKSAADPAQASAAFFELMKLDPRHPEAEALLGNLEKAVDAKLVVQARTSASEAQKAAESAGADKQPTFQEGAARSKDAEAAVKAGRSASAVKAFFEARDLFDRARKRSS